MFLFVPRNGAVISYFVPNDEPCLLEHSGLNVVREYLVRGVANFLRCSPCAEKTRLCIFLNRVQCIISQFAGVNKGVFEIGETLRHIKIISQAS